MTRAQTCIQAAGVKRYADLSEDIASKKYRPPPVREQVSQKWSGFPIGAGTAPKRHRIWAPCPPMKRLAPEPEVILQEKRRCIQFVCSFLASLA